MTGTPSRLCLGGYRKQFKDMHIYIKNKSPISLTDIMGKKL